MRSLAILFFMLLPHLGFTQTLREILRVDGKVLGIDGKKVDGVRVALLRDGEEVEHRITAGAGKFVFNIPLHANYYLVFSKTGYRSKFVEIFATGIPEQDAAFGYEFGGLEVRLFKNMEGLSDAVLDRPVAEIFYDTKVYKFVFNVHYFEEIKEEKEVLEQQLAVLTADAERAEALQAEALRAEELERVQLEQQQLALVNPLDKKGVEAPAQGESLGLNTELNNEEQLLKIKELAVLEQVKHVPDTVAAKPVEVPVAKEVLVVQQVEVPSPPVPKPIPVEKPKPISKPPPKPYIAPTEVPTPAPTPVITTGTKAVKNVYRSGNKTITEYVLAGSTQRTLLLKKVVADWGGRYFFKGQVPVTEVDFDLELDKLEF